MPKVPVFTIGYAGRTPDEVIALLKEHGVTWLVDVRTSPVAGYWPDFEQDTLKAFLAGSGISYMHIPELGGKQSLDLEVNLEAFRAGLGRIVKASLLGLRVSLMCAELDPGSCHRSKWIGARLVPAGIEVQHIGRHGELLTQRQVESGAAAGQHTLFE